MPERLVACTGCGHPLSVSAELAVHPAVRCPHCGATVPLPEDLRLPPPLATFAPASSGSPPVHPEAALDDEEVEPSRTTPRRKGAGGAVAEGDVLAGLRIRALSRDLLVLDEEINLLKPLLLAGAAFLAVVVSITVITFMFGAGGDAAGARPWKLPKAIFGVLVILAIAGGLVWAFFYTVWQMGAGFRFDRADGKATFTHLFGLRSTSCPLKRIQGVALSQSHHESNSKHNLDDVTLTLVSRGELPLLKVAELELASKQTPELVSLAVLLSRALDVPLKVAGELQHGPKRLRRALERVGKPLAP